MNIFDKLEIRICEDCIGDKACVNAAPETFEINDDEVAVLTTESTDTVEDVLVAAESCPLNIITVIDKETGEQLYPID
jgi:ferredoxin